MLTDQNKAQQQITTSKKAKTLRLLAVIDLLILVCLVLQFGWTNLNFPNLSTPAGSIIIIAILLLHITESVLFIVLITYVTLGIIRTIRSAPPPKKLWRIIGSINFIIFLNLIGILWLVEIFGFVYNLHNVWPDRLLILEHLASVSHGDLKGVLPGFNQYKLDTNGKFIFTLIALLYLTEKYLFELWGRSRLVTLLPILAISSLMVIGIVGEIKQKNYVNRQQWNAINSENSWSDSVAACEKLGQGWRLPHREELALWLAKNKPKTTSNIAWTSTLINDGGSAVVVQTSPERSGLKRDREIIYDHNPCVRGGSLRLKERVKHWSIFNEILAYACSNYTTPSMFPSKEEAIAVPEGLVKVTIGNNEVPIHAPYAETICIKPELNSFSPGHLGQKYANENNFDMQSALDAFLRNQCQNGKLTSNPNTCLSYK